MSQSPGDNPFDRFDLDPCADVETITERMRELAQEAPEAERQLVRDTWETLTLEPRRRMAAALSTFIDRDRTADGVAEPLRIAAPKPPARRDVAREEAPPPQAPLPVGSVHGALAPSHAIKHATFTPSDRLLEALLK